MQKHVIREYIKSLGVPYTFIDVGAWMQAVLPLPPRSKTSLAMKAMSQTTFEPGDAPVLLSDLNSIGPFVARILADERTVNQAVMVWEDERPMHAAWDVGPLASGESEAMNALKISVSLPPSFSACGLSARMWTGRNVLTRTRRHAGHARQARAPYRGDASRDRCGPDRHARVCVGLVV